MKFILYDIILNVLDVDESYEAHAKIQDKFILISTPGDKFRNYDDDKFLFDFNRDDTFKNYSSGKVNTKFKVFSNIEPEKYNEFYARISRLGYLKLSWRFKRLWIQKIENLMWFTNLIVAVAAIILSTYVAIKLKKDNSKSDKIEILNPTKLDETQMQKLINVLEKSKSNNTIKLDSTQLNQIIKQLENRSKSNK